MSKIAVQIFFGQNPEPFLEYALRSVAWADYVTAVNTAPGTRIGKENQKTLCDTCAELNLDFRYDNLYPDKNGHFSFSEARNKCLALTDIDDYVLIVDADDVHYPMLEEVVKEAIEEGTDSLTCHFYHLMVYKNLFQFVQPREILFKNYPGTHFEKPVHEVLISKKRWPKVSDYKYLHYGYIKPQHEIFNRWKFYSDLEGDFTHYDGQNPDTIVDDRISVSQILPIVHPPVIQSFIKDWPEYDPLAIRDTGTMYATPEKVGLIMIVKDDEEYLHDCFKSLAETPQNPEYELLIIDTASSDASVMISRQYSKKIPMEIVRTEDDSMSLAEALNYGLDYFRTRDDIQYIGWIHPDMVFEDPYWLRMLWKELQDHPKIGKICAANTRDPLPEKLHEGHEQCYIIRKDIINKIGLFDEKFVGIGGYEDWDLNKRIMNHDDYKIMTTPAAQVYHKGMGTRSKRDTTEEQIANAKYYQEKWNTSEPPV